MRQSDGNSCEDSSVTSMQLQPYCSFKRQRGHGASKNYNRILCVLAIVAALPSAVDAFMGGNNNKNRVTLPYDAVSLVSASVASSSKKSLTRLQLTNQPSSSSLPQDEDDEEAFRNLYLQESTEGMLLGKEFEQRQTQLENDRKRLTETFNIDASMMNSSASLFNTASNAVVISTPSERRSLQQRRTRTASPPPATAAADDNWALILCTSLTAQLSQQAAVLQDSMYTHQEQHLQLQKQQSLVILFCALGLLVASSSGYMELTSHSEIPSPAPFHII
ncbi:unnamed protein product [Cylindrotheca closterium]|uniref:Uncharacterized protein n=1 Tax=Cylindrotheca closterium TaxID=2856 RepID=A0AAD2CVP7_9STRA|nr:unnamed protein product [Cylindrotheca closterium]